MCISQTIALQHGYLRISQYYVYIADQHYKAKPSHYFSSTKKDRTGCTECGSRTPTIVLISIDASAMHVGHVFHWMDSSQEGRVYQPFMFHRKCQLWHHLICKEITSYICCSRTTCSSATTTHIEIYHPDFKNVIFFLLALNQVDSC